MSKLAVLGLVLVAAAALVAATWPTVMAHPVVPLSVGSQGSSASGGLGVGSNIVLTSVVGGYRVLGEHVNGSATATLNFSVTGALHGGYTLSVVGGTISVGGQTLIVTGGTAQLGVHMRVFSGQVTAVAAGSQAQSTVLFMGRFAANINGAHYYVMRLDFTQGGTEYLVTLIASAQET